jgi:resuscitation-promoting factor RpfA
MAGEAGWSGCSGSSMAASLVGGHVVHNLPPPVARPKRLVVSKYRQTKASRGKWSLLAGWRSGRWWGAPAVAAGLGPLELALVRLTGPPGRQLEVLRQLGEVGADPLASLLALLALAAEGLTAYLLAVLGLRLLALLPGAVGRLAAGATVLATPAMVRRAFDVLLGGALLAQATLTPATALPALAAAAPPPVAARAAPPTVAPPPALPGTALPPVAAATPPVAAVAARAPTGSGRSGAPAPLPPWLAEWPAGGGGSNGSAGSAAGSGAAGRGEAARQRRPGRPPAAAGTRGAGGTGVVGAHAVRPGDTLWAIAEANLPPRWRSAAIIDRYWRQVYDANRAAVGPDPDLIHPGTRLLVPRYRPGQR